MLIRSRLCACVTGALLVMACGDDTSAGGGGQGQGGENVGAGNMGGENVGAGNMGGENVGAGNVGGEGGDGGTGGEGPVLVNGCSMATATDMTGMATVTLAAWTNPHAACTIVNTDTDVTWAGTFSSHPLVGGVTPATDNASPITAANASGTTATVTFAAVGEFPYHCNIHQGAMQGVIYVVAPN